jgi:K+-transporting ATPase ATPase A chain
VSAWAQAAVIFLVLAAVHAPMGNYLAHTLTSRRHLRAETALYRLMRVDPLADQPWTTALARGVAVVVVGLDYLHALALGPLAEGLT